MSTHKIAAGNPVTLQAAADILEAGGNAYDAAVSAVFTSMTAEFTLTGPCGGGALLAVPHDKKPVLFDFFVDSPPPQPDSPLDFFDVSVDFGPAQQIFHIGRGSVAIPGNIAGLLHVHKRLGKIPIDIVLEPAINAARNGVIVDDAQAYVFKILHPIFCNESAGKDFFCQNGRYIQSGDQFSNPRFADLLEAIVAHGADYLYKGYGAHYILNHQKNGGWIQSEHLQQYHVIERDPVRTHLGDVEFLSNPTPSVGGTLISFLLKVLEKKHGHLSLVSSDQLAEAMTIVSAARKALHTNADDEHQLDNILKEDILSSYSEGDNSQTQESDPFSRGATTHVSILDKHGNAASVTTTNGEGCGFFIPELGIMMNNMLGEEDVNPLGFHAWNRQRRLPTMISPSVILRDGNPILVLGSGGSNRIRSAISQVILNTIFRNMPLSDAIKNSRLHVEGKTIHTEPGLDMNPRDGYYHHPWDEPNLFFGGVNAVTPTSAVGDFRRGGVGIVME